MTATQKVFITAAIAAAVGIGIYKARQASTYQNQVGALQQQQTALSKQLTDDRESATRQLAALRAENERLNGNTAELLRLRGEVTPLRQAAAKVASLESELSRWPNADMQEAPAGANKLIINHRYLAREAWSDKSTDTPTHAFETMLWAGMTGNDQRLKGITIPGGNSVLLPEHPPFSKVKGVQIVSVEAFPGRGTRIGAIVEHEFYGGGLNAPPTTVQKIRSWNLIQTNGEWKVTGEKALW